MRILGISSGRFAKGSALVLQDLDLRIGGDILPQHLSGDLGGLLWSCCSFSKFSEESSDYFSVAFRSGEMKSGG